MPKRTVRSGPAAPTGASTQASTRRLLAVDDDEKILQLYRDLLGSKGFEVTTCADPTKAVEVVKSGDWEVTIPLDKLQQAEVIISAQKKLAELFGVTLNENGEPT